MIALDNYENDENRFRFAVSDDVNSEIVYTYDNCYFKEVDDITYLESQCIILEIDDKTKQLVKVSNKNYKYESLVKNSEEILESFLRDVEEKLDYEIISVEEDV
jgi:hypothetical protein